MTAEKIVENGVDEEEHNFSDEEGFVDTIDDEELIGDVLRERPKETEAIECCVIIDGIPCVGPDRLAKLRNVLNKLFVKVGPVNNEEYPVDENGNTKGYVFVEFSQKIHADQAVDVFSGYRLDKSHTFKVNSFADLDKFQKPDDDWTPPVAEPYKDLGDLNWWLMNKKCMDQYSIQFKSGDQVSILWNNIHDPDSALITSKHTWTETITKWSPRGTYFATFHSRGVAIWAGQNFEQLQKFAHPNVQFLDFSPNETYLVTYSQPKTKWGEVTDAIRVWEVKTGALKRAFPAQGGTVTSWPYFKWSSDDKFFAHAREGLGIVAYETPSFGMLDKKPIKIDGVKDFIWSPADPVLAYWVQEQDQIPARVVLMQFPSKREFRTKNMFNVAEAELFWQQPTGDHLAVKLSRYGKKRFKDNSLEPEFSNVTHHLEIYRMRQKDIPVETMELKEGIQAFAWEPTGNKFCVLQGSHLKPLAVFYRVEKGGIQKLTSKLEAKQGLNTVMWAPAGGWLVLACLGTAAGGQMVFVDASGRGHIENEEITVMNDKAEHGGATGAIWDPSGRYLCTYVSQWDNRSTDLGYRIWNFQGRELQRQSVERFCQFQWRPRPPTLLSEKQIKELRKDKEKMKQYEAKFETEDCRDKNTATKEVLEKRQKQKKEFEEWRAEAKKRYDSYRQERIALRDGIDTDLADRDVELAEEQIELPLTHEETVVEQAEE